jgi:hypothetical protein
MRTLLRRSTVRHVTPNTIQGSGSEFSKRIAGSALTNKLAGGYTFLRSQACGQHRVKASQTESVRVIAGVFADLYSAPNAKHLEIRLAFWCLFTHLF